MRRRHVIWMLAVGFVTLGGMLVRMVWTVHKQRVAIALLNNVGAVSLMLQPNKFIQDLEQITRLPLSSWCQVQEVSGIWFPGEKVTDAGLEALVYLPALTHLTIEKTGMTE